MARKLAIKYSIMNLQSYNKEKTMEETKKDLDWHPTDYLEFENNNDTWADEVEVNLGNDYEIQVRDGKTFIVRKKPKYTKTYEKCYKIVYPNSKDVKYTSVNGHYWNSLQKLSHLLLCRDAYWKIAGEQMGLGKPWEPDTCQVVYAIARYANEVVRHNDTYGGLFILEFPTKEMRDAFYENFKNLIESCKELL